MPLRVATPPAPRATERSRSAVGVASAAVPTRRVTVELDADLVELDPDLLELDPDLADLDPDLVELDADLVELDPDPVELDSYLTEVDTEVELDPALLQPVPDGPRTRIVASLLRLGSKAGPAFILLNRLLVTWGQALGRAAHGIYRVARRWLAARAASWASGRHRQVLVARVRNLWAWPETVGRLSVMAVIAFSLGCVLILPFALGSRRASAPVAVDPVAPAVPSTARAAPPELPPAPEEPRPSRAQLARQMALEAFASGQPLEGVMYFRIALRAQRRVAGDDLLIVHTIAALADRRAAGPAGRLLRALGEDARRLLEETALRHPDPLVRARAWQIVKSPVPRKPAMPRGFGRWFR